MMIMRLLGTAATYLVVASIAHFIMIRSQFTNNTMMFIIGAIIGAAMYVYLLWRDPVGQNTLAERVSCGSTLAVSALVYGTVAQMLRSPFNSPVVTIGMAVVGSFCISFVVFNNFWKSFGKKTGE